MGGSITVVSTPAIGSTFTFHFPLQPTPDCTGGLPTVPAPGSAQQANHAAQMVPRPPLQTGGTAAEGKLVLVVEDDTVNSRLAGKMLHSLGYRAEFAADGFEALSAFVPGKYYAILMDVVMPRMDGVEATKRIREVQSGSHVPIIALTANVMPGDRERYLAAGMDDFLSKPFKREELAAKLARIVKPTP